MPIYDYKCDHCLALTEANVHVDQRHVPVACRLCGSPARKQISIPREIIWIGHRPGNVTAREIMNGADPLNPNRRDPSFHALTPAEQAAARG